MRQIVLDTETTGLQVEQGHRLIEIGCIELIDRKITGSNYHQYINPEREVDEGALNVHGISNTFLQDKPLFIDIVDAFMDYVNGAELIIHNATFDVGFINAELNKTRKNWKPLASYCHIVDTLLLARQLHVGQRNSLDALCKRYSIDNTHRELHGALLDAHLLAQVYLAMTGGQGSLFGESEVEETARQENQHIIHAETKKRTLCVVRASSEEMIEHEKMLQALLKKGKCEWLN